MANLIRRFAMGRKANPIRLERLRNVVESNPGKRAGFLARKLGWRREEVNRAMTTLNDRGVLFSEDESGGLWPFKRNN
jgi:hypothetical protein